MKQKLVNKINDKEINYFLFDLDGTLYSSRAGVEHNIRPQMWKCLANELNTSVDEAHTILWNIIVKHGNETIGLQELGINLEKFYDDVYRELDISLIQPYDGLAAIFEIIHSNGIRLGLITNSGKIHADRVLKRLNLYPFFENIHSFEDGGYQRKPSRKPFQSLMKMADLEPNKCLYFDDSMPNLYTASKLGFNTMLVSNGLADPPFFMEMHYRVRHEAPEFVDDYCYSLVEKLGQIISIYSI